MSGHRITVTSVALTVVLTGAVGLSVVARPLQEAERSSSISRAQAEALVADDPEMTPLEREGFVNGLLVGAPRERIPGGDQEIRAAAAAVPPDAVAELTAAGGEGTATVHLVVGDSGEVIETRYVGPKASTGTHAPLDAYGAWAAELGQRWGFEPPEAAPYSLILDVSHKVGDNGTTYRWRLRTSGRLVEQPTTAVGTGRGGAPDARRGSVDAPAPLRVQGNVDAPKRIYSVPPVYPAEAQTARVQGAVVVEATIGTDGRVERARILESIPLLDDAAIEAVMRWRYEPTVIDDEPVPVIMTVTVNFTLD